MFQITVEHLIKNILFGHLFSCSEHWLIIDYNRVTNSFSFRTTSNYSKFEENNYELLDENTFEYLSEDISQNTEEIPDSHVSQNYNVRFLGTLYIDESKYLTEDYCQSNIENESLNCVEKLPKTRKANNQETHKQFCEVLDMVEKKLEEEIPDDGFHKFMDSIL